jgi:hypothetical protein
MNECQALYPDPDMSDDDEREENEFDDEDEDEESADAEAPYQIINGNGTNGHVNGMGEQFYDINTDPNDIQLSERGQQILRRLNINYERSSLSPNEIELNSEQYEDANDDN